MLSPVLAGERRGKILDRIDHIFPLPPSLPLLFFWLVLFLCCGFPLSNSQGVRAPPTSHTLNQTQRRTSSVLLRLLAVEWLDGRVNLGVDASSAQLRLELSDAGLGLSQLLG